LTHSIQVAHGFAYLQTTPFCPVIFALWFLYLTHCFAQQQTSSCWNQGCYSNSSRDWTTYLFSWIPWWIKAGHQETKTFCSSSIKVFLYTLSYFYLIFHQITLFLSWLLMRILFFVAIDSFHCCCDDCSWHIVYWHLVIPILKWWLLWWIWPHTLPLLEKHIAIVS